MKKFVAYLVQISKALTILLLVSTLFSNKAFADYSDIYPMESWDDKGNYFIIDEDGSYYFKDKKGNVQIRDEDGNVTIEDKNGYTYYFDYDDGGYAAFSDIWFGMNSIGSRSGGPGVPQTNGWQMLGPDKWIYIENGKRLTNSWKQHQGAWYYFDNNGEMVTGWQIINGKTFYFNSSGAMATGWQVIDGIEREFSKDGVLIY